MTVQNVPLATRTLDEIVASFDLNQHPFYQDWRAGTLPVEKLGRYAAEYAAFVDTIDEGWETLGFEHYAVEEREHEELWAQFSKALGIESSRDLLPQTDVLVTAARKLMSTSPEAIGALYAFEAQQPRTSRSKLDGLIEHYPNVSEAGREYFRIHADDVVEAQALRGRFDTLSESDQLRAKAACAVVCSAMWTALDGVYAN